ncbi:hypothetical protein Y1Q_0005894 [Alligator mississippiensis]|uniref:Uncharacterized protein n=1 Tax=Alligator mississippiensis TaxID=8496 RepID=A0A151M7M0_ALLMI|nr:hypothetical protein Y1Q_0005894 [Alligator mississippiensis]
MANGPTLLTRRGTMRSVIWYLPSKGMMEEGSPSHVKPSHEGAQAPAFNNVNPKPRATRQPPVIPGNLKRKDLSGLVSHGTLSHKGSKAAVNRRRLHPKRVRGTTNCPKKLNPKMVRETGLRQVKLSHRRRRQASVSHTIPTQWMTTGAVQHPHLHPLEIQAARLSHGKENHVTGVATRATGLRVEGMRGASPEPMSLDAEQEPQYQARRQSAGCERAREAGNNRGHWKHRQREEAASSHPREMQQASASRRLHLNRLKAATICQESLWHSCKRKVPLEQQSPKKGSRVTTLLNP